ncbi:hypothetical protein JM83_2185 [Gillisia sp. Hel_I_86]|uniref:hypothetical protein n=1 Tax=Gillisia sp. Hel_I_86 TaxID=1249981 RepID=UPI00119B41AB|nr:hypothetical protein [Gillisia sp. Hel_I_86]TVZ27160.1 hypothetical protein JM83_2185 [Gillisia sp. Hel_I_86]
MDTEKEIKSLIWDCVAYLREEGYSEPRVKDYHRLWSNGIEQYMDKKFLANYHTGIGESFLSTIPPVNERLTYAGNLP